jgi:cytochrome c556
MADDSRAQLFEAMRKDFETMAHFGDDERALYAEIMEAGDEIIKEYAETFLNYRRAKK